MGAFIAIQKGRSCVVPLRVGYLPHDTVATVDGEEGVPTRGARDGVQDAMPGVIGATHGVRGQGFQMAGRGIQPKVPVRRRPTVPNSTEIAVS